MHLGVTFYHRIQYTAFKQRVQLTWNIKTNIKFTQTLSGRFLSCKRKIQPYRALNMLEEQIGSIQERGFQDRIYELAVNVTGPKN